MPIRKRGRPCNSSRALERIDDLDVMALRPGDWRKTNIRTREHKNGVVTGYRTKPNKDNAPRTKKKTVVWTVLFTDAPGGSVDYEMEETALKQAMALYQSWQKDIFG
jgi:hypothetical protein